MSPLPDTGALGVLLAPFAAQTFLEEVLGRNMLHVEGEPAKFAALFSWRELNRLLAEHRLAPPRLRLARKGVPAEALGVLRPARPPSVLHRGLRPGQLDPERLHAQLRDGATLILDAVEEACPPLAELCDGLARCLAGYAQVNAYATFRDVEGFGLHWDDHDVLVLQVAGRKAWRVFAPTCDAPLVHDAGTDQPPTDAPVFAKPLAAGDALYLPRGWWHAPLGMDEPSLHLTIALPRPTGADLLDWLVNRAARAAVVRRDLPQFADAATRRAHARELKAALEGLWSEDTLAAFLHERRGLLGLRGRPSLPFGVAESSLPPAGANYTLRFTGVAYTTQPSADDPTSTVFTLAGHTCEVGAELTPALQLLLEGREIRLQRLRATLGQDAGLEGLELLLGHLLRIGAVEIGAP